MKEQIKKIMSDVFGVPESDILDDAALNVQEGWDSIKHVQLILALEEWLEVTFDMDEIVEMISLPIIEEKVAAKTSG